MEPPASVTPQHKEKEVETSSPEIVSVVEVEERKVQIEEIESRVEPSTSTTITEVKDEQTTVTQA